MDKFTVSYKNVGWKERLSIKNVTSVMALEKNGCVVSSDEGTFVLDNEQDFDIRIELGR